MATGTSERRFVVHEVVPDEGLAYYEVRDTREKRTVYRGLQKGRTHTWASAEERSPVKRAPSSMGQRPGA